MGISRRQWIQAAGLVATAAGTPMLAEAKATAPANLSLNENPWGPSAAAVRAMQDNIARVSRYAFPETMHLVQLIAEREGVSPDMVVVAAGSSPILQACGEYFARDSGEVITAQATFEVLYRGAAARGANVVAVPFDDRMRYDLDAMQAKVGPSTGGVYICNPNNPTSTMVDTERLKAFAAEVSKTAPVFIDEAYIDMTDAWPNNTMAPLVREGRDVIVCRTFSKLHGLAGQRVGYAIMPAEIASAIRRDVSGGGMNRIGIAAATASYQDTAFATEMRLRLIRGRQMMTAMADRLGLTYAPDPQANFIYVRTGMPNRDFVEKMEGQGVLVVRRGFPGHDDWNRICVGADTELAACETALKRVLA